MRPSQPLLKCPMKGGGARWIGNCTKEPWSATAVEVQGIGNPQQAGELYSIDAIERAIGKGPQILRELLLNLLHRPPMAVSNLADCRPIEATQFGILNQIHL